MLDIGGVLRCRIYQWSPDHFQIYIKAESLGIEPGEVVIENYMGREGDWYVRLYTGYASRRNPNKRTRRGVEKVPEYILANLVYYNEMIKICDWEMRGDDWWFTQDIKASILLPTMKERSKIPNSLIYKDEYWRT